MRPQRCNCRIVFGKLGFGQRGVDFIVTNLVKQNGRAPFASAKLWYEVMKALLGVRRNWPVAQWTDWIVHGQR